MHEASFPWVAFTLFQLTNNITPGPNCILLASSGSTWGFKKTIPHIFGIVVGFPLMLLIVLYGSGYIFKEFPFIFPILTAISLLYVFWLCIRVFRMSFVGEIKLGTNAKPMTFFEAVAFQWINGKAWQTALMTATLYASTNHLTRFTETLITVGTIFVSCVVWVELGKRMAIFLKKPLFRLCYFSFLAIALFLSTWPTGISSLMAMMR